MSKLDGKVAVITGAARGIGATASRLFAAEGSADGIRVNAVNLSPVDTHMMQSIETMHGVAGRNDGPLAKRHTLWSLW